MGFRESLEPSSVYFYRPFPIPPLSQEAVGGDERSLDIWSWAHPERSYPIPGGAMGRWDGVAALPDLSSPGRFASHRPVKNGRKSQIPYSNP